MTAVGKPAHLMRWVVEREPLNGAVCIHIGDIGWARLQTRELVSFERKGSFYTYKYSDWQDILVEASDQLLQAGEVASA